MRKIVLLALKKLRGGQQKISGNDLCKSIIILFKRTPKDSKTEMAGLDSDFAFLDLRLDLLRYISLVCHSPVV